MQSLNLLTPQPASKTEAEAPQNSSHYGGKAAAEQFDSVMGRALAKPPGDPLGGTEEDGLDKGNASTTKTKPKPKQSQQTDPNSGTQPLPAPVLNTANIVMPDELLPQVKPAKARPEATDSIPASTATSPAKANILLFARIGSQLLELAADKRPDARPVLVSPLPKLEQADSSLKPVPIKTSAPVSPEPAADRVKPDSLAAANPVPTKALALASPSAPAIAAPGPANPNPSAAPVPTDQVAPKEREDSPPQTSSSKPSPEVSSEPGVTTEKITALVNATPTTKAAPGPIAPSGKDSSAISSVSQKAPATSGTSGAKYELPMDEFEQMNENDGAAEQKLPAADAIVAGEVTPGRAVKAAGDSSVAAKAEKLESVSNIGAASPTTAPAGSVQTTVAVQVPDAASTRALERTQDLLSLHAMRLRDSGNDSMEVVIKPGNNLHLSLNLQMRGGGVEVQAQLHRGDYGLLSRHWPELQQHLEQRGIRLSALSSSDTATGGKSTLSQQQPDHRSGERPVPEGAFAEFALAGAMSTKTTTNTTPPQGWESWA